MRSTKGFTLIELLAVIVIIAIIALIGIPSVTSIINNSRKDSVKSTALAMSNAARNALAANNVAVPFAAVPAAPTPNGCYITWDKLSMESNNLPVGGAVDATKSGVLVQTTATGDKNTYTVYLVNTTSTNPVTVSGVVSTALARDDVKIGDSTAFTAMTTFASREAADPFAKTCF